MLKSRKCKLTLKITKILTHLTSVYRYIIILYDVWKETLLILFKYTLFASKNIIPLKYEHNIARINA